MWLAFNMKLLQWIYPQIPPAHWLTQLTADDAILLRQDGVYAMRLAWPELASRCYVLQLDAQARAFNPSAPWQPISDQQWVELVAAAEQVVLCPKSS